MDKFIFYKQFDQKNCGPTCLKMVARYYGKSVPIEYLNEKAHVQRDGTTLSGISEASESIGLKNAIISISYEVLKDDVQLPCICYWKQRHFIVVYRITKNRVYVADPAFGKLIYKKDDFLKGWINEDDEGIVMLFEPSSEFYSESQPFTKKKYKGFKFLIPYLYPHKKSGLQVLTAIIIITFIQVSFPFLTQSIVDIGIINQDINFIYLILIAQLFLVISQTLVQIFRDKILIYVTNKININLVSDYLLKLMNIPLSYYDSKNIGDIMQRIQDNTRVQNFISSSSLITLISFITFIIFSFILAYYNTNIFIIFFIGSLLYFMWSLFFLKKREELDYRRFDAASGNQTSLFQLITGMTDIRINGSERKRRWEWESIQVNLFKISLKSLSLNQTQNTGAVFINEVKNIIITVTSASLVIKGEISLGVMLSIQYIIGQLNLPIANFINFIQSAQDAKLSIKRIEEINSVENDEKEDDIFDFKSGDITFKKVSFRYGEISNPYIYENLNLTIEKNKTTAIVGVSGSGKTTLLKMLLKYYTTYKGKILLDNIDFNKLSAKEWRKRCGVVMQEGFIFSGTIEDNITESENSFYIDKEKLYLAARIANISEFIESLPNGYKTIIGRSGMNLSGGQNQRILIARAIYKDPEYLFFDEATSALDAQNEEVIMNNLYSFFQNKTVVIIAHRLSTVKNADNIIVIDKGNILETGTHEELVNSKGKYYELIKNQLELG